MTGLIAFILSKKFTKKTVTGLGALKGSPCKIKEIIPIYSPVDPTVVVDNKVIFEWDSNNTPSGSPIWHEEEVTFLGNGRGIYNVEHDASGDTATEYNYLVTFYDGTTDTFKIPKTEGHLKKIEVTTLPAAATADKLAFYVVPIPDTTPQAYMQYMSVENDVTGNYEWLLVGTSDMGDYQLKIDSNIDKNYPNYDPKTQTAQPTAPNVVGAINEFNAVLNATYNYGVHKIDNLTTHTKSDVISALNEVGDITDFKEYDPAVHTTVIDEINEADKEFEIKESTTATDYDTKTFTEYELLRDNLDGTAKTVVGEAVHIPRVDVIQRATPLSGEYKTYDLKMDDMTYNSRDYFRVPYGRVDIPTVKIKKADHATAIYTDTIYNIPVGAWTRVAGTNTFKALVELQHKPITNPESPNVVVMTPSVPCDSVTLEIVSESDWTANIVLNNVYAGSIDIGLGATITYEAVNPLVSTQYWLQIEGLGYSEMRCGAKIDIDAQAIFKDVTVKVCEEAGVPLPELEVGDKYIDFEFVLGDGSTKHSYLACKGLIDINDTIIDVESLPALGIKENNFYRIKDERGFVGYLDINDAARAQGWYCNALGIHNNLLTPPQDVTYEQIEAAESTYIGSDKPLGYKTTGPITVLLTSAGTHNIIYGYENESGKVYHYFDGTYHLVATEPITDTFIDNLDLQF